MCCVKKNGDILSDYRDQHKQARHKFCCLFSATMQMKKEKTSDSILFRAHSHTTLSCTLFFYAIMTILYYGEQDQHRMITSLTSQIWSGKQSSTSITKITIRKLHKYFDTIFTTLLAPAKPQSDKEFRQSWMLNELTKHRRLRWRKRRKNSQIFFFVRAACSPKWVDSLTTLRQLKNRES